MPIPRTVRSVFRSGIFLAAMNLLSKLFPVSECFCIFLHGEKYAIMWLCGKFLPHENDAIGSFQTV